MLMDNRERAPKRRAEKPIIFLDEQISNGADPTQVPNEVYQTWATNGVGPTQMPYEVNQTWATNGVGPTQMPYEVNQPWATNGVGPTQMPYEVYQQPWMPHEVYQPQMPNTILSSDQYSRLAEKYIRDSIDLEKKVYEEQIKTDNDEIRRHKREIANEKARERQKAQYDEVVIDVNGHVYCETKNLQIKSKRRDITNLTITGFRTLACEQSPNLVFVIRGEVKGNERRIYIDEKKLE